MNDGYGVLEWARQNKYTVSQMSKNLDVSRSKLSEALNKNKINLTLTHKLYQTFGLRVVPYTRTRKKRSVFENPYIDIKIGNKGYRKKSDTRGRVGRSKLDPHIRAIQQLLNQGSTQRYIASLYNTTESNLYAWMKRRGLKRSKTAKEQS